MGTNAKIWTTLARDLGWVSAHRSKKAAEKQAKLFDGGRVINTPQWAKKILKGKPYIVKIP
jgi:hypothetical protein